MALIKRSDPAKNSHIPDEPEIHTVLGPKAQFEGKLFYEGSVRIDGIFKGEIESGDTLILGESAEVRGNVKVGKLIVKGLFEGVAHVREKAELLGSAQFFGDLTTKGLMVEEGVVFEGTCKMHRTENKIEIAPPQIENEIAHLPN